MVRVWSRGRVKTGMFRGEGDGRKAGVGMPPSRRNAWAMACFQLTDKSLCGWLILPNCLQKWGQPAHQKSSHGRVPVERSAVSPSITHKLQSSQSSLPPPHAPSLNATSRGNQTSYQWIEHRRVCLSYASLLGKQPVPAGGSISSKENHKVSIYAANRPSIIIMRRMIYL